MQRLTRSAATFRMGPVSRNYLSNVRVILGNKSGTRVER